MYERGNSSYLNIIIHDLVDQFKILGPLIHFTLTLNNSKLTRNLRNNAPLFALSKIFLSKT